MVAVTTHIPAREVHAGMSIVIIGNSTVWTVLDRHPQKGFWWIHRRDKDGKWITSNARYSDMKQVIK